MPEKDEFTNTAQRYIGLTFALQEAIKKAELASREVDRVRGQIAEAKAVLGKHVGLDVTRRAAAIDGRMLMIEYGNNNAHTISIFDEEGRLVR